MAYAVKVIDVFKKFGKPNEPLLHRLLKHRVEAKSANGQPGANRQDKLDGKRRYIVAVDHVSFSIEEGEIFGILGPNGGGKSTLIRLISTLLLPDSGQITVFNFDAVHQPLKVQERINRVSVEASFFKKLSPMENLMYGARLYGMEGSEIRQKVVDILTRFGLEKRSIFNPMEDMSRGMQQKVAIARALLTSPRLLLLDEPTTGLDPRSKREVQSVILEIRREQGTTILLTTHDMIEDEALCDRIAIMNNGKIVAMDTPSRLKQMTVSAENQLPSLEEVFLEFTGKKLVNQEEELA
jgi:ABC-2 type transport system ATP-binding protein